jgi:hypothetical protein
VTHLPVDRSQGLFEVEVSWLAQAMKGRNFFQKSPILRYGPHCSGWTPSIMPKGEDHWVYLVMDDLGSLGRVWREADASEPELEAVILDLLAGQYKSPIRVVALNTAEHWSQDVSGHVAQELRRSATFRSSCRFRRSLRGPVPGHSVAAADPPGLTWHSSAENRQRSASRRPTRLHRAGPGYPSHHIQFHLLVR